MSNNVGSGRPIFRATRLVLKNARQIISNKMPSEEDDTPIKFGTGKRIHTYCTRSSTSNAFYIKQSARNTEKCFLACNCKSIYGMTFQCR